MANNDIGGVWRTVGGRRIFIKDGEDLKTAMKNSGKFGKKEEEKEDTEYRYYDQYDIPELQKESNIEWNKMSDEQKTALRDYTNIYYKEVNKDLYDTKGSIDKMSDKQQIERIKQIDSSLQPLKEDVVVYKGTAYEYYMNTAVGEEYTINGFNSTTVSEETSQAFFDINESKGLTPCELEIRVPKGTKAFYLGENSKHSFEKEMLLERGLKYKIIKNTTVDYFNEKKTKIIMEVVK